MGACEGLGRRTSWILRASRKLAVLSAMAASSPVGSCAATPRPVVDQTRLYDFAPELAATHPYAGSQLPVVAGIQHKRRERDDGDPKSTAGFGFPPVSVSDALCEAGLDALSGMGVEG